jgi:hypothetical protein
MLNWKGWTRNCSWPTLRFYAESYLHGLRNTLKPLSQDRQDRQDCQDSRTAARVSAFAFRVFALSEQVTPPWWLKSFSRGVLQAFVLTDLEETMIKLSVQGHEVFCRHITNRIGAGLTLKFVPCETPKNIFFFMFKKGFRLALPQTVATSCTTWFNIKRLEDCSPAWCRFPQLIAVISELH